jgi:Holliday junction resolvase RusA-like endonuclease
VIEFVVYGSPAPQGSKSFKGMVNGHAVMAESSKNVKPWRMDVKAAAEAVRAQHGVQAGALFVTMVFTLPKPKSAAKTRKTWPDRKPDLSKLVRSTEDAITDAGLWDDDARVVHCNAGKVFPGEHLDSLDAPGVRVRIGAAV